MESSESDDLFHFIEWANKNLKVILYIVGALAGIAAVIAFLNWKKGQNELAANDAVFALPALLVGPGGATANSKDYLKVADQHSSTQAGERALLLGAGLLFTEGKYPDAQAAFQKFLSEHGDSSFRSEADFGVAAALEAQGKTNEAMARYEEVGNRYLNEASGIQSKLNFGRMAENARNYDKALKAYTDVGKNIQSPYAQEGHERSEQLLSRHPELVKTNAAPAIPSTAPALSK
ncbi:MAG: Tetratricopeptide 2 repeat protein [Verrucomicrobiales bacterium]|nr:Tetratricopeptide 2 repeat protein [Verrucomicrobiales bacterium]